MQDLNSCIQPSYVYRRLCFLEYIHSWSMTRSAIHFSYLRLLSSCIWHRFCSSAGSRIFQHLCHFFCKWEERVNIFGVDHTSLGACVWINPHICLQRIICLLLVVVLVLEPQLLRTFRNRIIEWLSHHSQQSVPEEYFLLSFHIWQRPSLCAPS